MIHSIPEIQNAIAQKYDEFAQWIADQPDDHFDQGPEGKWSTGQHLGHLIQGTNPLNMALNMPRVALKMQFGKPNRPVRSYDEVVQRYLDRLAQAGTISNNPYGPKPVSRDDKGKMLDDFLTGKEKLVKNIGKWNEEQLDDYLLPHPLMGKMLVREVLFFMVYHTEHHLNTLKEKYVFS
ncbi:MAG: DinB family protein [Bacteroidetes bacterium]|nr:DinB family protein [Bacteroidota bacterium]